MRLSFVRARMMEIRSRAIMEMRLNYLKRRRHQGGMLLNIGTLLGYSEDS